MSSDKMTYEELEDKISKLEMELAKTQWLHDKENVNNKEPYIPFYGDVIELNTERTILETVGKNQLEILTSELMDLLDTSVAIYEKNGDYAYGVFNSSWCQLMDASSRKFCNTDDNKTALTCGKWLCHDDCWNNSAKAAILNKKSTDIDCIGEIKLYAEPIFLGKDVVGVINIGYGNPPTDDKILKKLSEKFSIEFDILKQKAADYKPRPDFIIEISKKRLKSIAKLIGEIINQKQTEKRLTELHKQNEKKYEQQLLFNSAINSIADIIKKSDNQETILENANRILGETLQLDWTLIYYICFVENYIEGLCEWMKDGHPDIDATKNRYSLDLFKKPFQQIKNTRNYLISNKSNVNEHYKKDGSGEMLHGFYKIKSLVWYPFDFDGNNFYVFTLNQILHERNWTKDELDFIGSVAKQISLALMKLKLNNERQSLIENITERKKAEQALKESEEKFRTIFNMSQSFISVADMNTGTFKFVNPTFKKVLGYDEKELYSTPFIEFVHPEDRNSTKHVRKNKSKKGIPIKSFVNRYKCKDGNYRYLTWNAFPIPEKKVLHMA